MMVMMMRTTPNDTSMDCSPSASARGILVTARKLANTLAPMTIRNIIAKVLTVSVMAALKVPQLSVLLTTQRMRARKAPTAAAWFTEKKPENIPPSTAPNSRTTPQRPFREENFSLQVELTGVGAIDGLSFTMMTMVMMARAASMMPGRMPAMNCLPMDSSAMMQ